MEKTVKKVKTLGKLKKDVWTPFSLYIRTRDCLRTTGCKSWGLCITCGKRYHIKLLQAGHYIPGRYSANLFMETGVHAQCYNCNINLKGNTHVYAKKLIELYGEGHPEFLHLNNQVDKKFTRQELEELKAFYEAKIKEL